MTIKNNKLNGTDFIAGELLTAANLNDTNNAIIDEHRTLVVSSAQQSYEILKASGSIDNEDFIFADRFTSAAGVKSTVDTVNSTATFSSNKYVLGAGPTYTSPKTVVVKPLYLSGSERVLSNFCKINVLVSSNAGDGSNDTEQHSQTFSAQGTGTTKYGVQILPKNNCVLKTVTKHASSTSTRCYLRMGKTYSTSQLIEGPITYSGNTATFAKNIVLQTGNYYWLENDAAGSSYNIYGFVGSVFPLSSTNCIFTKGVSSGTETTSQVFEIVSFVTQNTTGALTTISNVTIDISDGTTTLSAQNINDTINISSLGGGQLKLTYNLSTTDTTITPEIYGYGGILK